MFTPKTFLTPYTSLYLCALRKIRVEYSAARNLPLAVIKMVHITITSFRINSYANKSYPMEDDPRDFIDTPNSKSYKIQCLYSYKHIGLVAYTTLTIVKRENKRTYEKNEKRQQATAYYTAVKLRTSFICHKVVSTQLSLRSYTIIERTWSSTLDS